MKQPIYIATSPGFILVGRILYVSVALALLLANLPWSVRIIVWICLLLHFKRVISLYGRRNHKDAVQVLLEDCRRWRYELASGEQYQGDLLKAHSFSSSLVIILYLQHRYTARYIVIPRDAISMHAFRYLTYKMQLNRDIIKSRSD